MNLRQMIVVVALAVLLGCDGRGGREQSATDQGASTRPQDTPASTPETRPKSMHWGPKDPYGLQLGAWIDSRQPAVRCVIRNQGDRSLRYSDYLLGDYSDCKSVVVRGRPKGESEWQIIPSHKQVHCRKSAGASGSNVHLIHPGREMPFPYESSTRGPKYTFGVNLTDFDWPGSWTGTIEILISQKLGDDGSQGTWKGVLKSAPLEISMQRLLAKDGQRVIGVRAQLAVKDWCWGANGGEWGQSAVSR